MLGAILGDFKDDDLDDDSLDVDDMPEKAGACRYVIAWQGPGNHTRETLNKSPHSS